QFTSQGNYVVVVSNAYGVINSSNAVLTVNTPPSIPAQPQRQSVAVGDTVVLSVVANGSPPLTYQWRFNDAALAGATGTNLVLTNIQLNQQGNYSVAVSNAFGGVVSAKAFLRVFQVAPPTHIVGWGYDSF